MQGLEGHGKEFEFYSKYNAKFLKALKQTISIVHVMSLKDHPGSDVEKLSGKGQELEGEEMNYEVGEVILTRDDGVLH